MKPLRWIFTLTAALAIGAAVAAPAAAAAPTYSGLLTCTRASDGQVEDLNTLTNATKKDIAGQKKRWTENGYCVKGSVDASLLTRDE